MIMNFRRCAKCGEKVFISDIHLCATLSKKEIQEKFQQMMIKTLTDMGRRK